MLTIKHIHHYGDVLAIPFFIIRSIYFYKMPEKKPWEYTLYFLNMSGLVLDTYFAYMFFIKPK